MSHWTPHDWAIAAIAMAALALSIAAVAAGWVALDRLTDLAGACSG